MRAKTSATPGSVPESKAPAADSGPSLLGSFASYDPATCSWKTSQRCLGGGWIEFSETWPRAGTMLSGIAYRQEPSAPISAVTACLSLPILPGPTACDFKGSGRVRVERGANGNLRDWWNEKYRFVYPPARCSEYLMGFPIGHTDLEGSETP